LRSIPTGCDISTRRANQQPACDGAVKREIFLNGARQTFGDLPVGHQPASAQNFFSYPNNGHHRQRVSFASRRNLPHVGIDDRIETVQNDPLEQNK
jgi:hypothetical protein